MSDFINTNEIRDLAGQSPVTHFEDCWKYHPACMVHRLCDEIDSLRQERTALLLQRDEMLKRIGETI
jgi:hypothetical protein